MAGWLIPTLKAILPHVSDVVAAVRPVFTRKKAEAAAPATGDLLQQQIAELQAAAAQNADHIKELAAQLQSTVAALKRAVVMCVVSMAISVVSLFVALAALSLR